MAEDKIIVDDEKVAGVRTVGRYVRTGAHQGL